MKYLMLDETADYVKQGNENESQEQNRLDFQLKLRLIVFFRNKSK